MSPDRLSPIDLTGEIFGVLLMTLEYLKAGLQEALELRCSAEDGISVLASALLTVLW